MTFRHNIIPGGGGRHTWPPCCSASSRVPTDCVRRLFIPVSDTVRSRINLGFIELHRTVLMGCSLAPPPFFFFLKRKYVAIIIVVSGMCLLSHPLNTV